MKHKEFESVHYHQYLQLDKVINAQAPRSEELNKPAHDEMLFIITHQAYELWFKQILHEIGSIMTMFHDNDVDERNVGIAVSRLNRVSEILKILIDQIRILETMTPLDFLDFRNYLLPASGFQSFQFRKLEVCLGLADKQRITYGGKDYKSTFTDPQIKELESLEAGKSLLELVEEWLERTPFLEFGSFKFLEKYQVAVTDMISRDKQAVLSSEYISDEQKNIRLRMLDETLKYFNIVLSKDEHDKLIKDNKIRLSYQATTAALLINLYRDEPILQLPFQLISSLIDIDQLLTSWRYTHAGMVLRMIGQKIGTGGSSGHGYLKATAERHSIFMDLKNISTLLIPRSDLPVLPEELKKELGFYFSTNK